MPRLPKAPSEQEAAKNAAKVTAMLSTRVKASKPPRSRGRGAKYVNDLVLDVKRRIEADDWKEAGPDQLLALHCWAHEEVYGVSAVEEVRKDYSALKVCAKALIVNHFDGVYEQAMEYVKWLWARELDREKWRRDNPDLSRGGRLTPFAVLRGTMMLTDFRLAVARVRGVQ